MIQAVPKPSVMDGNITFKKCSKCGYDDLVYVRKKNCPKCKSKGTLITDNKTLTNMKKRPCECGCGQDVIAPRRFVSGHNVQRNKNYTYKTIHGRLRAFKDVKCTECGKKFERRVDQINRRSLVNLCSQECRNSYQSRNRYGKPIPGARNGEYRNCKECGSEFYIPPSYARKGGGKFCSRRCLFKWRKETGYVSKNFIGSADNSGKNNGRYKHGRRVGGHINKKKLREKVIERDGGNWCLLCGKPGPGLHLHRIVYGSQGGKYELDNCVQLCPKDHDKVHSSKRKWMPYLLDYVKGKKASGDL